MSGAQGDDLLNGGVGDDLMSGGMGNDRYYVDSGADLIEELPDAGDDRVYSTVDHHLGEHLERLILQGDAALSGQGNSLDNSLYGNSAANVLEGLDGDDRLYGRDGNDFLSGAQGDDLLNGGTGDDLLSGGMGNDRYYVDSGADLIQELADAGDDRVYSTVDHHLGEHLERLILQGDAALSGQGNSLDNFLYGNSAANVLEGHDGDDRLYGRDGNDFLSGAQGDDLLNGGAGDDLLSGGMGNDRYYVDSGADLIQELPDAGDDRVYSTVDHHLGEHLERLILQGEAELSGQGNSLDNSLYGNSAANVLEGLEGDDRLYGRDGNDVLIGNEGNDILTGGKGSDSYRFTTGDGHDVINNQSESLINDVEQLILSKEINKEQLWFSQQNDHLIIDFVGSEDQIKVLNWFEDEQYQLDEIHTETEVIYASAVNNLVTAMSAFKAPEGIDGYLTVAESEEMNAVIAASWS